jgi:uncharacterized membrane protein YbhN (UPF0104 family)
MTTAVRTRRRPDKTMAWTAAKILLFAGVVALGIAANIAWKPVTNPGVQDCGAPITFFLQNRENVLLHPGEPGAPSNAVALAEQPTCRERAYVEIEKAGLATATFFGLTLLGIILGLLDDRIAYWSAPRFESLLRDMPRSSRIEHGLIANVDVDELGDKLPPLETPEIYALIFFGLAAVIALPYVGPIDAVRDLAGQASIGPLLLAMVAALVSFVAAAVQRKAVFPDDESWITTIEVVMATSWVGRLRPVVGTFGIDIHHLRRTGLDRATAILDVQVLQTVSILVHLSLLALATLQVLGDRPANPSFERPQLVLAGVLGLFFLSGLSRAVKRWRALAVRPHVAGITRLHRVAGSAVQLAELFGGTVLVTLANVTVLALCLHAFGGSAPFSRLLFVYLVTAMAGAFSPTPNGVGVFEGSMVLLLFGVGVDPATAVCAALAFRSLTFWLPMLPGIRASQRMRAAGAL